ncbi:MAG: NifB/NifX family molybdenum-iron cluster-binding protein [Pseudobdellovibrionaceae bacterium]
MRIAVTSQNFKTVTNHAGKCRKYIIYEVEAGGIHEVERLSLPQELAFSNFCGESHPLDGVNVLLSLSFGKGFLEKMKHRNITASLTRTNDIEDAIIDFVKNGQILPEFNNQDCSDEHSCSCH